MTQRSILITGAGSGIGRATARAFIGAGWRVALVGRREDALRETAGTHEALVLPLDVTDPAQVDAGFARVESTFGRLDVLFNNAGMSLPGKPIDEIAVADWLALSNVNITGMFLCARAAFGLMRRQSPQGGRIINNGSISADRPRPGSAPYTMSKHAVSGLTKTLAVDGRRFDIACGQIDIGNAASEMTAGFSAGMPQASGEMRPEPLMPVVHVAEAVLHMANLPPDVNVPFMTIMARDMPYLGRG
ncbi:MAG: SDR family oxidoreductase [Pseudotabrizicola sp.]|uniref:SDR family oxidoreductase n=1 Tax=Pseudotabrizicola sp. TaxID=2939647 RepID=UPI00271BBDAD|nr:SDR family oxidoreductase [Pseudotabrizicola sp.]MDO8882548.1 SDR family oxidoreductase [Pseudotabrizicola sp.]MDP2079816.1 SDR family oxidoreductase [Pseudotabrizicola sp.]MDZ7574817.1 SDR family oxidoreductase [Pseudotabrizicola sp.]